MRYTSNLKIGVLDDHLKNRVTGSYLAIATKCWITVGARGIMIESLKLFLHSSLFFADWSAWVVQCHDDPTRLIASTHFFVTPQLKKHSAEWWCYFSCQIYHPYWPTVAVTATTITLISKTICFFCTDGQLKKYNTQVCGVKPCGQNIG